MGLVRLFLLASLLLSAPALADDAALVVANESYDLAEDLPGAGDVAESAAALSEAGIDTQILRDADRETIGTALRQLEQQSRSADGLLVALAGRFVYSADETWLLPTAAEGASLVDTAVTAIPVSTILGLLARTPGRAILLLGVDPEDTGRVAFRLRRGIGRLDIPQGVTVLHAGVAETASILKDTLAVKDASLVERARDSQTVRLRGFRLPDLSFLTSARGDADTETSALSEAEKRLWNRMSARDTEEAYELFLDAYPDGRFAAQAERRLAAATRDEPFRDRDRTEESIGLDRDDRARVQRDLVLLGYDTRGIDGVFGPGTRAAIRDWQGANGEEPTGYLTREIVDEIDEQARRRATLLEEDRNRRESDRVRAEEAFWQETGQGGAIDGLERFLDRFPNGDRAEEARARLAELREAEGLGDAGVLRDRLAWNQARERNTIESYTAYARDYPRGLFADRARSRIAELQEAGGNADAVRAREGEDQLGLNRITRRAVEQRLAAEGFDVGRVDGDLDTRARNAIRDYQQDAQLPVTGYLSQMTVVRLLADSVRRVLQ